METVNRNIIIKVLMAPPREATAAFKEIEKGAKAAGKSVKDIAPSARVTTAGLKEMAVEYQRGLKASEMQTNRLAVSIRQLGLTTKEVTVLAKQLGAQWKLTGDQINAALAKAGRAPMAGARGGGLGGMHGLGVAGVLGGASALPGAFDDAANIARLIRGEGADWEKGHLSGLVYGVASSGYNAYNEIFDGGSHRKAAEKTTRMEKAAQARAQEQQRIAEREAMLAPRRAAERSFSMQSAAMRDDIAGMGRLDPLARQRAAGLRTQFGGTLGGLDVFGKAGEEFARAQSDRFQDVTKSGGRAAAQAELALGNARAERGRAVAEQGGIRQQLAGAHPSEVARIADLNQQLVAASTRRKDAEAAIVQAMRQQQQVGQQNLGTISEMAKQAAEFARQQAKGAREKFGADVTALGYEDPEKIRALRDVAERLKGGRDVDPEMLRMARGAGLGLGDMTDARAKSQALANPDVQALIRATGIQRKVEDQERQAKILAEVAVRVEQKLETKVEMDAASVAKQLADNVLPAVHKLMQDTIVQLRAEAAKARVVSGANRNAAPP